MNYFLLAKSPVKEFTALVFATGTERPHSYLAALAGELRRQDVRGRVIFDLLMANGARSSRFFAVNFDGVEFDSFEPLEPMPQLTVETTRFYCEHFREFDTSLLTPAARFALRRGVALAA